MFILLSQRGVNDPSRKTSSQICYQVEEFNCEYLVITKEMLAKLVNMATSEILEGGTFEEAQGFFWGFSDIGKWKDTLEILTKALIETDFEQESILYYSWW